MLSSSKVTVLVALFALASAGCVKSQGKFTWVDDFRQGAPPGGEYVISPGDTLNVRVFQQENISSRVRVRADGKLSVPLVNDVDAAGLTPAGLARKLEAQLKAFINNPVVTVSLEEVRTMSVSVLGEVVRPGAYAPEPGAGLLQVLAMAGGLSPFAHDDGVFVLRRLDGSSAPTRIRFTYPALARAEGNAGTFTLRSGDVVVVE